jgi:hypothetical protein
MILFIVIGLALTLGVNWLYSRFCENLTKDSAQFFARKTQNMAGRRMRALS